MYIYIYIYTYTNIYKNTTGCYVYECMYAECTVCAGSKRWTSVARRRTDYKHARTLSISLPMYLST